MENEKIINWKKEIAQIIEQKKAYNQKSEDNPKGLIECPECHKKTLKLEAHCCTCSNCGYSTCN